jgi:hypothetical protein
MDVYLSVWKKDIYVSVLTLDLAMRNTPNAARSELSNVTAFVAAHPRALFVAAFLLVLLLTQGTVSAELEPISGGGLYEPISGGGLYEPNGGHGASTGP